MDAGAPEQLELFRELPDAETRATPLHPIAETVELLVARLRLEAVERRILERERGTG